MQLRIPINLASGMDVPSSSQNGGITGGTLKERMRLVYLMNASMKKWERTPEIVG